MTDSLGRVTVYQSTDSPLKPERIAASTPRVMDCIDCHNRPTHIYQSPVNAVDLALSTGRIDRTLPYIKRQAVQALASPYATTAQAQRSISDTLMAFYRSRYDSLVRANPASIARSIAETQRIYAQNFFPAMKVSWRAYPNDIGHWDFVGCDRCHDGSHASAGGRTISSACTTCHTIVAQGGARMDSSLAGLGFRHPVDIGDGWQQAKCSDCHGGALVD